MINQQIVKKPFNFQRVMDTALEGYIRRPKIESEITSFIQAHQAGCCIVVGEAGSGKSALAAALIRSNGYLHHFLRKGQTEFNIWRDAYGFLTTLGFQLKDHYGENIFPNAVGLDVKGNIRQLDEGGSYTCAEIDKLVTVPWRSITLKVDIEAEDIQGEAVGVKIREVIEDYRSIPLISYRQMALMDPLIQLRELMPQEKVVLWIDGLDEEADILPYQHSESITDMLPLPEELTELSNLCLVISSRPGRHLDRFSNAGAHIIYLESEEFEAEKRTTVKVFIERELRKPDIQHNIESTGYTLDIFKKELIDCSELNFLYLRHLFLAAGSGEIVDLLKGGLPDSLDSIYVLLLDRINRSSGPDFLETCHPILEILAVTYQSLSTLQISHFSGIDLNQVNTAIQTLQPFLDEKLVAKEKQYNLYHRSFRDCLISSKHQEKIWFVESQRAHRCISNFYLQFAPSGWNGVDAYGFDFLSDHLQNGGEASQQQLIDIIDKYWRIAKRKYHKTNRAFLSDLEKAVTCAQHLTFPRALIETTRLTMMYTLVDNANQQLPQGALEVMVGLGQHQRSFDFLANDLQARETASRRAEIIKGLQRWFADADSLARSFMILRDALAHISRESKDTHFELEQVLRVCKPSNDPVMIDLVNIAVEIFNKGIPHWFTPRAMRELGRLLTAIDEEEATKCFEDTLTQIYRLSPSSVTYELGELLTCWAAFKPRQAWEKISAMKLKLDHFIVKGLMTIACEVFRTEGQDDVLVTLLDLLDKNINEHNVLDPYDLALSLIEVSRGFHLLGKSLEASKYVNAALYSMRKIATNADPEMNLQNRQQYLSTTLLEAATVDWEIDRNRAQKTLHEAWRSFAESGCWWHPDFCDDIVSLQLERDIDLLDAYINTIQSSERKSEILIAHARIILKDDPEAARKKLEQAIDFTEYPKSFDYEVFYLNMAKCMDSEEREDIATYLDTKNMGASEIVHWRLHVLQEMIFKNNPDCLSWLKETISFWSTQEGNTNFICELPAFLWKLPDTFIKPLVDKCELIPRILHRLLFQGALSARIYSMDIDCSAAMLHSAQEELIGSDVGMRHQEILSFWASQWWNADVHQAEKLLLQALLLIENFPSGSMEEYYSWHSEQQFILKKLMYGPPNTVLSYLLFAKEPPPPINTYVMTVPSILGSPYVYAGMTMRDYSLSLALADHAIKNSLLIESGFLHQMSPQVRSLTISTIMQSTREKDILQLSRWFEIALEAANEVQPLYLRDLFKSEAILALHRSDIKQKAEKLALEESQDLPSRIMQYGTLPLTAQVHALGQYFKVLVSGRHYQEVLSLMWQARTLTNSGVSILLGYLPILILETESDPSHLKGLRTSIESAMKIYPNNSNSVMVLTPVEN